MRGSNSQIKFVGTLNLQRICSSNFQRVSQCRIIPQTKKSTSLFSTSVKTSDFDAEMNKILQGKKTSLPFSMNALQVLSKRYLLRDFKTGQLLENPEQMFERVAKCLAEVELMYGASKEQVENWKKAMYEIMANFEFTPAGRTLANAGGPTRLVANCIVLHIEDSMESIFETLKDAALLQKAGSGLGFPFHKLRPAGSPTKTSSGIASGPVSFLHVYNSAFGVIRQQNRHGANMAVMSVDHPDILEFIHCKDREGDINNFNISVGITDEFMQAIERNDKSTWMCSFNGNKYKPRKIYRDRNFALLKTEEVEMSARDIFNEIVKSAWLTGEPGVVFLDSVNKQNPLPGLGRIEACNPCGEQFLHDSDVCNLGSINLEKFVKDGKIDFEKLEKTTKIAVRMLDNVIDITDFPVGRVNQVFRANRRVGLGIMGFADMLFELGIGYNSEQGRQIARQVMGTIQKVGENYSEQLAKEKGNFPNWKLSKFAKEGIPRRNAAITNVPPTGSIAMMFDVSGGVEPYFALSYYYKGILGGQELTYVNKHLRKSLEKRNLYNEDLMKKIIHEGSLQKLSGLPDDIKKTFVTSMDISAEDHILMQGAFQENCDNAISKTINFPNSATTKDIEKAYFLAWKSGCKGCTVYRDGSRELQVLNLNKDKEEKKVPVDSSKIESKDQISKEKCPECGGKLIFAEGCSQCSDCGMSLCQM